jgi:DNA-binding transcriptional LysR family regulator
LRDETPTDVRQEHLFDDPLAIVVRVGHPLAAVAGRSARPPTSRELGRFPWIAPRPGSPLRRRFDDLMTIATLPPPATPIECNSLIAARALLLASDRMMLLSEQQVREEIGAGQLTLLPHPRGPIARAIGLTVRRDWIPTDVQRELIDALRTQARALAPVVSRPAAARRRAAHR